MAASHRRGGRIVIYSVSAPSLVRTLTADSAKTLGESAAAIPQAARRTAHFGQPPARARGLDPERVRQASTRGEGQQSGIAADRGGVGGDGLFGGHSVQVMRPTRLRPGARKA